jgi:hypothetical protein
MAAETCVSCELLKDQAAMRREDFKAMERLADRWKEKAMCLVKALDKARDRIAYLEGALIGLAREDIVRAAPGLRAVGP